MRLNSILLLSILSIFTACSGQSPAKERNSTIAVGDTVTQIADCILLVFQDKSNNYWFGSNGRGVYRYDGKTLVNFTTKHGLSNNCIGDIQEDKEGNIFIGTTDGINKYDGKAITHLKPLATNANWKLLPGDLWFKNVLEDGKPSRYDGNGLHQFTFPENSKEAEYRKMFPNVPYSPYGIYTIYTDSKGRIWFGTAALGVGCFDGKAFTWINEDDLTEIHNGPSNGIRSIQEDKNGDFWFSNTFYRYTITQKPAGGITYERKKGIDFPENYDTDGFEYLSATTDNKGNLWIVTFRNGVWKYDGANLTRYAIDNGVTLFSIYKDRQGNLWLGTHTNGVYKFNGTGFEKFRF